MATSSAGRVTRSHRRQELCDPLNFYQHIDKLYDAELYDDLIFLFELTCPEKTMDYPCDYEREYKLFVQAADAYFKLEQYVNSENMYKLAFDYLPESMSLPKNMTKSEVMYRRHLVFVKLGHTKSAQNLLSIIPVQSLKVQRALTKLIEGPKERPVHRSLCKYPLPKITSDTYKICSSAFGSAALMLRKRNNLGPFDTAECIGATIRGKGSNNVRVWLKSQEYIGEEKYDEAIKELAKMNPPSFRIYSELADLQCDVGLHEEAILTLKRLRKNEPTCAERLDKLAYLMSRNIERYRDELSELSTTLLSDFPEQPEPYVAMALRSRSDPINPAPTANTQFIVSTGQRACEIASYHCSVNQQSYTLIALAFAMEAIKKRSQSIQLLKQAMIAESRNPDVREVLIDMYIRDDKKQDAREVAQAYLTVFPNSAFAKYMCAKINFRTKGVNGNDKSIRLLKECIEQQPQYLDAIILLIRQYLTPPHCRKGFGPLIKFLKKCRASYTSKTKVNSLFGEVLLRTHQPKRAYEKLVLTQALDQALMNTCIHETEKQLRALIEVNGEPKDFEDMVGMYATGSADELDDEEMPT